MSEAASPNDPLVARLTLLLAKGELVRKTRRAAPQGVIGPDRVDSEAFAEWHAQSLHLLTSLLSNDAVYVRRFGAASRPHPSDVSVGVGVLKAVREDAENGHLRDLRALVAAEVFSSILDMAQHLLGQGYHIAAASLAGGVLEDGLRRIAAREGVDLKPLDGLGAISSRLAQAGVHSSLEQKRLSFATEVRDNADHGHFDRIDANAVGEMVGAVETYLAAHLDRTP